MTFGSRRMYAAALVGALALAVAGCGNDSGRGSTDGDSMSATPASQAPADPPADAKVIGVTIGAEAVSPHGDRVTVKRNQPVVLEIDAVAAGELHVHSSPEKEISFPAGKSHAQFTIDKPGVVDVEDHGLDKLIVQLEVK